MGLPAFFVCETSRVNREDRLIEALEPLASESFDSISVTVEVAGTRKLYIPRVFLDTLAGGITLDELVDAQEWWMTIQK